MNRDSMSQPIGLTIVSNLDGDPTVSGIYAKEVTLDCYGCDTSMFNRKSLEQFFDMLVYILEMEKGDLHFWDDVGVPDDEKQTRAETKGTSAIQFILTSNITVHCLDILERVYVNIFSCKDFAEGEARAFVQDWFDADSVRSSTLYRA